MSESNPSDATSSAGAADTPEPQPGAMGRASQRFLETIPRDFAREHLVLSVGSIGDVERMVVAESTEPCVVHNIGVRLGCAIEASVEESESIARRIDEAYATRAEGIEAAGVEPSGSGEIERLLQSADRDLLSTSGKSEVVKLVDTILFEALSKSASDVHIQPLADRTLVRYRVDGVLHTARELPVRLTAPVTSRIKVMGRMDIAEQRIPQDGRASVTIGSGATARPIDLRLSTLPTSYGERSVIRLLDTDRGQALTSFEALGMLTDIQSAYLDRAGRSSGIILLTGPTGSGKTTTLYTTLRWIAGRCDSANGGTSGGDLNVMTIEDPIEYELSTAGVAISQAQVNTKKGVTFSSGLRHILRQDPDVIMVGEIRDDQTARIAIQASLTGHLVFSTLHTNDAASAVTRLVDLGVEPYLVSSSLSAVLAQRLLRRIHTPCEATGCQTCLGSGYLGRVGIFELLLVSEPIRELVTKDASAASIRRAAIDSGMQTLHQQGERLVADAITSRLEVDRVTLGATDLDVKRERTDMMD